MNARRSLLPTLSLVACALVLSACFGSSSSGPPLPLSVEFVTAPPPSDTLGTNFQVSAAVSNGSKVNWACTPLNACGSFSPTQTNSNVATTYTPPQTVPTGGSVTIMAISVQDSTKEASANVTITPGGTIAVTFNAPAPPPSLTTGTAAQGLSATISSTVTNAVSDGVDWTATCSNPTNGCGSFSLAHTNSGTGSTTNYTAPPAVPAGGLAVTVTAASTLDPMDSVSAVIFVSSTATSAFLCAGCSYTYTVSGENTNGPYSLAGVFNLSATGVITGEQDFSSLTYSTYTNGMPDTLQTGSTYQFTPDGRGTITLNTGDSNIGVNGTETLGVAFVSANHLLITELDQSATASGTMDLQTLTSFSQSTLSGGYVFVAAGASLPTPIENAEPLGFGGVFVVPSSSPGTISSTSGTSDVNFGGCISTKQGFKSGSGYATPDSFGRVQITLYANFIGTVDSNDCGPDAVGPIILDAYITDATHLKFVEVDTTFGVTSGLAVGQGAATGTLSSASLLPANSTYVFTAFGEGVTGPLALVTTFTSDGVSKLQNGSSDVNAGGAPSSGTVTGSYSVDSAGTGRVGITLNGNVGNPGNTGMYALYLTGGSDPPMVLELDGNAVTAGNAYTQAAGPFTLASFQGDYGVNFTLFGYDTNDETYDIEDDISGQTFADGAGNLLGTLDINASGMPQQGVAFTGSYASSPSGRFTGSITIDTAPASTLAFSYFVVSPSLVVIIETDDQAVSLGLFQVQTPPF